MGTRTSAVKRKITDQDEFLTASERFMNFMHDNPSRVALYAVTVVAILVAVWGISSLSGWMGSQRTALEGEVASLYAAGRGDRTKISASVRSLEEIHAKNQGKPIGRNALYYAANLLFLGKEYQKAADLFKKLIAASGDDQLLVALANRNLAYCAEAQGNRAEAISILEALLSKPGETPKIQIQADLARLHEANGDAARARAAWEEIHNLATEGPFRTLAREKLGLPPEPAK